jgi:hypothetical protein
MNFTQAQQEITKWIVDFVEKPNPMLNGWAPCPYARQARVNNRVDIRQGCYNPIDDLKQAVLDEVDVAVYVYDRERWSADEFNQLVEIVNISYLAQRGLIALADHPDDVETVKGVVMNQGTYAIAFLQPVDKLDEAAKQLVKKGFYDGWNDEYLKVLFAGREDPRHDV